MRSILRQAFDSELSVVAPEQIVLKEWAREHQFLVEEGES